MILMSHTLLLVVLITTMWEDGDETDDHTTAQSVMEIACFGISLVPSNFD